MGKLVTISEHDYHSDREHVSKTWLDKINRSPLEPDRFNTEFVCSPKLDKRTKAGKEEYAQFEAENSGKVVVDKSSFDKAVSMRDSVRAHKASRALLDAGSAEQSVFWNDSEFEVGCKARGDWVRENIIVDLKTSLVIRVRILLVRRCRDG